jgi:peptidoglycan/xylan/chitin deacetylase (PgdA/CDA1 family)
MRRILAGTLHWASLFSGRALRRAKAQRAARILVYHGVSSDEVACEVFSWQLAFLRQNFELISLRELLNRRSGGTIHGDEIVITFDDGARNHFTTAYPILREYGAVATFFVCPALIDSGHWIWNHEFRCRLNLLKPVECVTLMTAIGGTRSEIEGLVARAKCLNPEQRQSAEDWVRHRTPDYSPSVQQLDRYTPMTWKELAGLDPSLITIGSHTLHHAILSTLSNDELRIEIGQSRSRLEQRIGREVEFFCYPNGDFDERAHSIVREHYAAAVTSRPGAVGQGDDDCLLPRIHSGETRGLFVRRLHRHGA